MKKIKEILIGTHNKGKIKEISFLLNKKLSKEVNYNSFVGLMKILEKN